MIKDQKSMIQQFVDNFGLNVSISGFVYYLFKLVSPNTFKKNDRKKA